MNASSDLQSLLNHITGCVRHLVVGGSVIFVCCVEVFMPGEQNWEVSEINFLKELNLE